MKKRQAEEFQCIFLIAFIGLGLQDVSLLTTKRAVRNF